MNVTKIEWCDFSANPLKFRDESGRIVWGCVHASPGCQHCYAETLAHRYGKGGPFNVPTMAKLTPFLDEAELRHMLTAKSVNGRPVSGSRVFVGDMTDVFGDWVPDAFLDRLFAVFSERRDVTWQVLTKRADRLRAYFADIRFRTEMIGIEIERQFGWCRYQHDARPSFPLPLPNVWLGVSCEDQQRAHERIQHLVKTPAAVRFISAEPLLGPVDLSSVRWDPEPGGMGGYALMDVCQGTFCTIGGHGLAGPKLDWVIVGGESGPGARPCDTSWVRQIVTQCASGDVPCFVKQLGSAVTQPVIYGPHDFSGEQPIHHERVRLIDRKGGDIREFPPDLRVREFPAVGVPA